MKPTDYLREKAARVRRMADAIGNPEDAMSIILRRLADRYDEIADAEEGGAALIVRQDAKLSSEPVWFVSAFESRRTEDGGKVKPQVSREVPCFGGNPVEE
jgi:hypothetical protein